MTSNATPMYSIWKSLCIVREMLSDRGYTPLEKEYTYEEFEENHRDANDVEELRKDLQLFCSRKNDTPVIIVFWRTSIGTNHIQEIHGTMKENGVTKAIIIYNTKITAYGASAIRYLRVQKIIIETFSEAEIQYNVTKHADVPRHIICSAEKRASVMEKYSATAEQFPKIKTTDPVCRYYGAVKGQMIKVLRPSDCSPEIITVTGEKKSLYNIHYLIVT